MWFGDKGEALGQMLHGLGFTQATLREQIRAWMATKDRLDDSETDAQRKWLHDLGYHQGTLELQWEAYLAALGYSDVFDYCAGAGGVPFDDTQFTANVQNSTTLQVFPNVFIADENYTPDVADFSVSGIATLGSVAPWSAQTLVFTGTNFAAAVTISYDPTGDANYMRTSDGTKVLAGTVTMSEGG